MDNSCVHITIIMPKTQFENNDQSNPMTFLQLSVAVFYVELHLRKFEFHAPTKFESNLKAMTSQIQCLSYN